jgi:hypothetical protein
MKLKMPSLGGLPKPETKITKVPGAPESPKVQLPSNPMKVGDQATVKTAKAKKMADGFGKASLFFKSEEFGSIKRPSIEKLRSFLEKTRTKR